jgi:oligopeptide transport system substrate-binding protein
MASSLSTSGRVWVLAVVVGMAACGGDDGGGGGQAPGDQVLTINLGAEPPTLDPGLVTDTISFNVVFQLNDPLVKLNDDLEPVPNLAESWELSDGGRVVTYTLRDDGKWTNGDPVTAEDFEWSWKRTIAPETAAGYAYQFFGIKGAADYNSCDPKKTDCGKLRDAVGVEAVDDRTLRVELTSPQPWFVQQAAHLSFLAVHRPTVEKFGEKWTEPKNIVTNGPFRLTSWKHNESLTLEKWAEWRDAASVKLERVEARVINDAITALQAFEADEIDACIENTCIPTEEIDRLKEGDSYVKVPALATQYLGFNVNTVKDVNLRRALALAVDRRSIIENITKADETPATGFTPQGMPGFDVIRQDFLTESADLERARQYLARAKDTGRTLNLFFPSEGPGARDIAVAVQADWKKLGIDIEVRGMEWAQFLEFIGPPPSKELDVYSIGWVADYVDAINFLELWTCESGNNASAYCDPAYDKLIEQARATFDDEERFRLHAQAEAMLSSADGAMPIVPLNWATFPTLRKPYVQGWEPNALDQYDFTKVSISEE